MKTNQILSDIRSNGGFCNVSRWTKKEIAQWIRSNYYCSLYVAKKVALYINH